MPEEEEGPASDAISFIENWDDEQNGPVIFIMRDFHYFLNPLQGTQ
jgi:hypothetical protein